MKKVAVLTAAIVLASAGGALAASKTVTLTGFAAGTNCNLDVHFDPIDTPLGQQTVVTTRASGGTCAGTGAGIGAIGTATVGGTQGQFLIVGQGINHQRNTSVVYVLQLTSNNKLMEGGEWGEFETQGGRTASFVDGGQYSVQ